MVFKLAGRSGCQLLSGKIHDPQIQLNSGETDQKGQS